jgi:predicted enzyme related to lactoylglutathione lyase
MPEVKKYEAGTFCWADLSTNDIPAAKKFYGEIFGWKTEDMPTAMGPYAIAKVKGKDAAAIAGLDPKQKMPPHWTNYFWVEDVEASAKKAASLGGKVVMPAMDADQAGRFAVIADPAGAMFCLWEQKKHMGAAIWGEPGALNWAELMTRNVDACAKFYGKLFHWEPSTMDMPGGHKYTVFNDGKHQRAGMMAMPVEVPKAVPSNWVAYFTVASCDKTTAKIEKLGGKLAMPAMDVPNVGRFAMAFDPQGAAFAVLQPASK